MSARSPYGLAGVSSLSRLVQTPFLAARLLLLALVAIFAFLSLIFAILHLYLTRQVTKGKALDIPAILVIIESCFAFITAIVILAGAVTRKLALARVSLECVGVGVLASSHILVTVIATVKGLQTFCSATASLCTTSALLMHVAFLTSVLYCGYFVLLFFATIAHSDLYPDIWARRVFDIEWFAIPKQSQYTLSCRTSIDSMYTVGPGSERPDSPILGSSDPRISTTKMEPEKRSGPPQICQAPSYPPSGEPETDFKEKKHSWIPEVRRGVDHPFGGKWLSKPARSNSVSRPRTAYSPTHDAHPYPEARHSGQSTASRALSLPVTVSSLGSSLVYLAVPAPLTPRTSYMTGGFSKPPEIPVMRFSTSVYNGRSP